MADPDPASSALPSARDGLQDPAERRAAGRMVGLLWMLGGVSGALWYLVPGAELAHWRLGLVSASLSFVVGLACLLAPWRRMRGAWIHATAGASLIVIPFVMAINGGADSPTVLYLFLATVVFGYYLPAGAAIGFLGLGVLVPGTPMLYDPVALEPRFIAEYVLTAPIYAAVGLTVIIAKRQLVGWRNASREQALHDPLTGLANRRAVTLALDEAAVDRRSRGVALVMVDLDDFKRANTLYGHVGGDRVLIHAAQVLRRACRGEDLIARLGGDEFAVLVRGASDDELAALCERVVTALRSAQLDSAPEYRLTASVGYAQLGHLGDDIDAVLGVADALMRSAKRAGKDRWAGSPAVPVAA